MTLAKGDRVVLNRTIGEHAVGKPGRIIRADIRSFFADTYTVLFDDGGAIEDLREEDLFVINADT